MYVDDIRAQPHKVRLTTKAVLTWRMWSNGYMPLTMAIRTFFA